MPNEYIGHFLVQTDLIMYRIAVILQIWFYTNLRFPQMQGDSIKVALKPAQLQTNMFSFVYSTKILRRSTVIFCFHKSNTVPTNLNAEFKVPCFWGPWVWLPRILIHFDLWQLHSQGIHRYIRFHLEEQHQNCHYQEVMDLFKDTLGCMPPLLAHASLKTCNRKLSLFWSPSKS